MKKAKQSAVWSGLVFCSIFLFMLLCNILTLRLCDDFTYHFSFMTKERITNVFQIFPSMLVHAQRMNGRLVAHSLVQLFVMFPKGVFNVVNAGMFTLEIFLLYRMGLLGDGEKKHNPLLVFLLFGLVWLFQPAFGQVNLWFDGSFNYLWGTTLGLLFLLPFAREMSNGQRLSSPLVKVLFVVLGFLTGAYSENASAGVVFMAASLLLLAMFIYGRRPAVYSVLAVAASVLGYISIYLAPAQMVNKGAKLQWTTLKNNFLACVEVLRSFWLLLAVFAVLFVLACLSKVDRRQVLLSAVFAVGAMASNFILIFAAYYAERSAFCVVIFMVAAIAVLAGNLFPSEYQVVLACLTAVLMLPTCYHLVMGLDDIHHTYTQMKYNETYIEACKAENILDVTIGTITADTKYSPAYGIKYIDTTTTETWPNKGMAQYYGLNSIIGTKP